MNTKYKATAQLSSDSYNKFTAQTLSEIYNLLKDCIPFDFCKCTFTYCSDNTTVSADINDIPKNLNVKTFEFFVFDFSQNDDYITASFTPDNISVTVCLPIDFKSSKALLKTFSNAYRKISLTTMIPYPTVVPMQIPAIRSRGIRNRLSGKSSELSLRLLQ